MQEAISFLVIIFLSLSLSANLVNEKTPAGEGEKDLNKKEMRYQKKHEKKSVKHTKWIRKNRRDFLHTDIHKKAY